MEPFFIGMLAGVMVGFPCGVVVSYFYAKDAIAKYHTAAAEAGVFFHTVEGKLTAIKKAL